MAWMSQPPHPSLWHADRLGRLWVAHFPLGSGWTTTHRVLQTPLLFPTPTRRGCRGVPGSQTPEFSGGGVGVQ